MLDERETQTLREVADEYGTPVYVYLEERLRKAATLFMNSFEAVGGGLAAYAYKANSNPTLCAILREEGFGAEVASLGELSVALAAGVKPERVVFNGVGKLGSELEHAVDVGVGFVNAENPTEAKLLARLIRSKSSTTRMGFRLNLDVEVAVDHKGLATGARVHKFGIDPETVFKLIKDEEVRKTWRGLHFHVGSQLKKVERRLDALSKALAVASKAVEKHGVGFEFIDVGGGFYFDYSTGEPQQLRETLASTAETVKRWANEVGVEPPLLVVEPGRCVVASCGFLLTKVLYVKEVHGVKWAILDAGMGEFLRPALYGAEHRVSLLEAREGREDVWLGGPYCESTDVLGRSRLPPFREGDLLAIHDVGAYGYSMSSNYHARPRPPEVLVTAKGEIELLRPRIGPP